MSIQDSEIPCEEVKDAPVEDTTIAEPETVKADPEVPLVAPVSEPEAQIPEPPLDENIKLCGVCNEQEYKYKCVRCYLPYCSIACSIIHKATHPATETPPTPKPQEAPSKPNGTIPQAGTVAAAGYKGPFAVLDNSAELKELFRRFPSLPSQLEAIHETTLRPVNDAGTGWNGGRGGKRKEAWNQDVGLKHGVKALKNARRAYGKDGEGVREYGTLVLQLLSKDELVDADEQIQKEISEENARIVRQLLDGEL